MQTLERQIGELRSRVSELERENKALRSNEARSDASAEKLAQQLLDRVLDAAPLSIFATDEQGVFTLHRGSALKKVGMEQGENVGVSAFELYGSLPVRLGSEKTIDGESAIRRVLDRETLRGETELAGVVFDNQFAPLLDSEGKVSGLVGVAFDITERKHAESALHESQREIRAMAAHLANVEEDERKRIASDLHDSIGQALAVAGLSLARVCQDLPAGTQATVHARLEDVARMIEGVTRDLRAVIAELRPPTLDHCGLVATLEWMAEQYTKRTDIRLDVQGSPLDPPLPSAVANGLIRIAQEALSNTAKHAGASRVTIAVAEHGTVVSMTVTDDGAGFDPSQLGAQADRWGLVIMRERAINIGASLSIESNPGTGTCIEVSWSRTAAPADGTSR